MLQAQFYDPVIVVNGIITLGAVIGGIKISMNGIHKTLNRLEKGQSKLEDTLHEHGNRLTKVETCIELHTKEE